MGFAVAGRALAFPAVGGLLLPPDWATTIEPQSDTKTKNFMIANQVRMRMFGQTDSTMLKPRSKDVFDQKMERILKVAESDKFNSRA